MSRVLQVLLVVCIGVALCAAQRPRHRQRAARLQAPRRRFNVLARQELEEPVTPYPSAKELKPEVPFEELGPAGPAVVPEAAAGGVPPGPIAGPGFDAPAAGPGIALDSFDRGAFDASLPIPADIDGEDDAVEGEHQPDLTYGPPEADEEENQIADLPAPVPADEIEATIAEEEDNAAAAEEQLRAERLVQARRFSARKSARPAKLRAAALKKLRTKARTARLQALPQPQQQFIVQPQFGAQQQPLFYYQMARYQMW